MQGLVGRRSGKIAPCGEMKSNVELSDSSKENTWTSTDLYVSLVFVQFLVRTFMIKNTEKEDITLGLKYMKDLAVVCQRYGTVYQRETS